MEQQILKALAGEWRTKFGNDLIIKRSEAVGGGCICRALRLTTNHGRMFLKWQSSCPDDLFLREAEGLAVLRKAVAGELLVPEVFLAKANDELPGFILMEYLETGTTKGQAEQLGYGLARLHRCTAERFGFEQNNYCGLTPQRNNWTDSWCVFFSEHRLSYLMKLIRESRGLAQDQESTFKRLIQKLPSILPASSRPALIHGDLWSGNYLYTTRGPALIDPAGYYADREMELSIMYMFGGFSPETWIAYQTEYPLDAGWEERVELYQLYHVLNHLYLFGGSYMQQALSLAKKFL